MENIEKLRALIVDDNLLNRIILEEILEELGIKNITTADDGKKALELCKARAISMRPFHLIISDIEMPQMSGIEFLEEVKEFKATNHIPFIMITKSSNKKQLMKAINLGINNYILKPFNKDLVKKRVLSAVNIISF